MTKTFNIGDRVILREDLDEETFERCIDLNFSLQPEMTGTVCAVSQYDGTSIGIDFDLEIDGHSCEGNCEEGHGWYVMPEALEYENSLDAQKRKQEKVFEKIKKLDTRYATRMKRKGVHHGYCW